MVILSVACVTKTASRTLVARQFVEMPRVRIEGLLAAFPKLVSSNSQKQHTFVETDTVRYVYHPFEDLYLVLITTKGSNIVEDLVTLRLLSKVLSEYGGDEMGNVTVETIGRAAFELVLAFDEVVAAGGHSEHLSLQQLRTNLEMDSHEEKLAEMIQRTKEQEALARAKERAAEIKAQQKEAAKLGRPISTGKYQGIGSDSPADVIAAAQYDSHRDSMAGSSASRQSRPHSSKPSVGANSAAGGGGGGRSGGSARPAGRRGLSLSSKGKANGPAGLGGGAGGGGGGMLAAMMAEDGIDAMPAGGAGVQDASTAVQAASAAAAAAVADQLTVGSSEVMTVRMTRDGGLASLAVRGRLTVTVNAEAAARARLHAALANDMGAQFQTHPNVSKPAWRQGNVLQLKDAKRAFPVGEAVMLGRWRWTSKEEGDVPLVVECWPEEMGDGSVQVNLQYNLQGQLPLRNVTVVVPLGTRSVPDVQEYSGAWSHNAAEQQLEWHIDAIDDSNPSGSLEFTIQAAEEGGFFPVNVSFEAGRTLLDLAVDGAELMDESGQAKPARFGFTASLSVDSYTIG